MVEQARLTALENDKKATELKLEWAKREAEEVKQKLIGMVLLTMGVWLLLRSLFPH